MGAQDSKLSFRRGIFRLFEERNISSSDVYWLNFWTLPSSAEDVFELFSPADIRRCRDEAPENMETLLLAVIARLMTLRRHPDFLKHEDYPEIQMLNCIRILTRLIPFLYENDDKESEAWREKIWWKTTTQELKSAQEALERKSLSSSPDDSDITPKGDQPLLRHEVQREGGKSTAETAGDDRPIAEELMITLVELLFFVDFTIPNLSHTTQVNEKVIYGIWETGVGCTTLMGTNKTLESNRIEVLRCILALLSKGMYVPANALRGNRHVTHLVVAFPKNVVLAILCSLLNTSMKYYPTTWRSIPYSSTVFTSDSRQLLTSYSLQVLLVLLCYPLPGANLEMYGSFVKEGEDILHNQFLHFYRKLHRPADFSFMVEGMSRILQQPLAASATYLPGSQRAVKFYPEMMLLFWETLQQNKRFRSFLIDTDRALDFMVLLLFHAIEHKTDTSQIGLVRMCVFILQPLSADSRFIKSLNKPFEGHSSLPPSVRIPGFSGSYADFLIVSIYTLITASKGRLVSLYSALIMTLSNVAPGLKGISIMASTKVLQLFSSISQPSFLFANETNFTLLQYLLEALTSVIENNFNENPHLIYAILRSHRKFEALQDLTIEKGVQDLGQIRQARAERDRLRAIQEQESKSDPDNSLVESGRHRLNTDPIGPEITHDAQNFVLGSESDEEDSSVANKVKRTLEEQVAGHNSAQIQGSTPSHSRRSSVATTNSKSRKNSIDPLDVPPSPRVMSEKARGKLPAGSKSGRRPRSLSRQSSGTSIHSITQTGQDVNVGHNTDDDFSPSTDWFDAWYPDLELGTLNQMLVQLEDEIRRLSEISPDPRPIIKYLQEVKLENILPRTPNPRTFVWSEHAKVWFESLLWGYIYVAESQLNKNGTVGVWNGTYVKLFRVQNKNESQDPAALRPQGGVDAVASTIVQKFANLGMGLTRNRSFGTADSTDTARHSITSKNETAT